MRRTSFLAIAAVMLAALPVSCLRPDSSGDTATLVLSCSEDPAAKSSADDPPSDLGEFILQISSSAGKAVYRTLWGMRKEELELQPGTYTVSLVSDEDASPAFGHPVMGDVRTVTLKAGEVKSIELFLSQQNGGIRLLPSESFIAMYRDYSLFLRCPQGTLAYGMDETRTAFFPAGIVSIVLSKEGTSSAIHTVQIAAGEMLTMRLLTAERVPLAVPVTGLCVTARSDSSRMWTENYFAYDGSSSGGGTGQDMPSGAVGVSAARSLAGTKGQWVYGYVVGGDLSASSCNFDAPFSARTNLLLGDTPATRDRSACLSVQLSQGDIRAALNLVDNPGLLGKLIYLKGDVVAKYYGLPGLQNLSDYRK